MGKEKDQVEKLKKQTLENIKDIAKKFGILTTSTFRTAQEKGQTDEQQMHIEEKVTNVEENLPLDSNVLQIEEVMEEKGEDDYTP